MQRHPSGTSTAPSTTAAGTPAGRHAFRGAPTGSASGRGSRTKNFSQLSTMRPFTTYDQDGRPWFFEQSIRSGMPCGPFQPKFTAPWYPNHKYFIVNSDNPSELYIDYPTMRADKRQALIGYHNQAVEYATEKGLAVPTMGDKYSKEIVGKIGTPPDSILPIIAAEQGNPWILGRTTVTDPRLVEHIKSNRRRMSVDEEGFDFGEASFEAAIAGQPKRATRLSDLPRMAGTVSPGAVEAPTAPAVGEEVGGFENEDESPDTSVGTPVEQANEPLVDDFDDIGPGDDAFGSEHFEKLEDLEESVDRTATGGHTFRPSQQDRLAKRAPRKQVAGARGKPKGTANGKPSGKKRPTLAEGARPVVSALSDDE